MPQLRERLEYLTVEKYKEKTEEERLETRYGYRKRSHDYEIKTLAEKNGDSVDDYLTFEEWQERGM